MENVRGGEIALIYVEWDVNYPRVVALLPILLTHHCVNKKMSLNLDKGDNALTAHY